MLINHKTFSPTSQDYSTNAVQLHRGWTAFILLGLRIMGIKRYGMKGYLLSKMRGSKGVVDFEVIESALTQSL